MDIGLPQRSTAGTVMSSNDEQNHEAAVASDETNKQRWFPLESNPDLLNKYISKFGFDTSLYEFVDVFSTESWALEMIPQPVAAVMVLYPITDNQEAWRAREETERVKELDSISSKIWWQKQRIGNACGTIGLIHALANIPEGLRAVTYGSKEDCWLKTFFDKCPTELDGHIKAEILESDTLLQALHEEASSDEANQTNRGTIDDDVDTHFIALVHVDGGLYELDGRKGGPIRHGDTNEMDLLSDACKVVEKFMSRDPGDLRFTILALAPKYD